MGGERDKDKVSLHPCFWLKKRVDYKDQQNRTSNIIIVTIVIVFERKINVGDLGMEF